MAPDFGAIEATRLTLTTRFQVMHARLKSVAEAVVAEMETKIDSET